MRWWRKAEKLNPTLCSPYHPIHSLADFFLDFFPARIFRRAYRIGEIL